MSSDTNDQEVGATAEDYAILSDAPRVRRIGISARPTPDGKVEFSCPDPEANRDFVDFALKLFGRPLSVG